MSEEEQKKDSNTSTVDDGDARIQIKPKDAAEQLLPGGKSVGEMTQEELTSYTSNMAKADRLYAQHADNLADNEREVFDALLLASDKSLSVEERFKTTIEKFNAVKQPKEEKQEEKATSGTASSPKGTMESTGQASENPLNNTLEPENDAPFGENEDYFKFLQERFKRQTTMSRKQNLN